MLGPVHFGSSRVRNIRPFGLPCLFISRKKESEMDKVVFVKGKPIMLDQREPANIPAGKPSKVDINY